MSKQLIGVFSIFENLTDPRMERTRRHELLDLVVVALCATIAGSDGWADIERFGNRRLEWLRTFLRLENGIPSHDTFGRVFSHLDPAVRQRGQDSLIFSSRRGTALACLGKHAATQPAG